MADIPIGSNPRINKARALKKFKEKIKAEAKKETVKPKKEEPKMKDPEVALPFDGKMTCEEMPTDENSIDITPKPLDQEITVEPCKKHKKYKAKLPPRVDCEACWKMYQFVNKKTDEEIKELKKKLKK